MRQRNVWRNNKWNTTFQGHEHSPIKLTFGEPPRLIRLGDGTLWQRESRRKDNVHYIPAFVEEINWLSRFGDNENN